MSCLPFVVSRATDVACKGASVPCAETITIRPDAQTGKQSWPCRELNAQPTPNGAYTHSRFGEKFSVAAQTETASFLRHFASRRLSRTPQCRIGKPGCAVSTFWKFSQGSM